jgi:hypothetical protein
MADKGNEADEREEMSDRNFDDFNDDFDDEFEADDEFLEAPGGAAGGIGGDRSAALFNPFIQELEQIPPEHLASLLQMIRLFRQSVALAERSAADAQTPPIQPTVLPPIKPLDSSPMRSPAEPPVEQVIEVDKTPIESLEPPPVPLRLPQSAPEPEQSAPGRLDFSAAIAPGETPVLTTDSSDESDWDELMDFLDEDSPKNSREQFYEGDDRDDSQNDDWDEYFRPSP